MFDVNFTTTFKSRQSPDVQSWIVKNFTATHIIIRLNFSNPIYVSTGENADILIIGFKMPSIFQSLDGKITLRENYIIKTELPSMMESEEEFIEKNDMASKTQNTMIISIVAPILTQVVFKFAMDLIWPIVNNL